MGVRPRSPGVVYGVLSLVLVALIAVIALSARQPPPPTIAEFAPQAVEQIVDAPTDQSSGSGSGGDGFGGADVMPTPSAALAQAPIEVSRVRRCVGDPPRQIEDPQSPPCVPYWAGDNGGATSKGVTRDEIRIAMPTAGDNTLPDKWEAFFNRRFEFYGRKLDVIGTAADICTSSPGPCQSAGAAKADEERKVFASGDTESFGGALYRKDLARRKIVSNGHQTQFTEDDLAIDHPYMWQYTMSNDKLFAAVGSMACDRLAGANAVHAGDPLYQSTRRTWGILSNDLGVAKGVPTSFLKNALAACGETVTKEIHLGSVNEDSSAQRDTNAILQMRQAGVTSVFCLCYVTHFNQLAAYATSNSYFPEWLINNYYLQHLVWTAGAVPPEQSQHMFGINAQPRDVRFADDPAIWALREVDPAYSETSENNASIFRQQILQNMYRDMLVLASGIQMAGPLLTPSTFAAGLHRTRFPNPDHPIKPGKVGFETGDHSMTNDVAETWWSNSARSVYADSRGAWCFVDGGERRVPPEFSSGDTVFFSGTCDSGS